MLHDALNLLSKLTFKRFWNGLLLLCSYYISKITKKNYHKGFPISISVEPTTTCNLKCPQCPSGLRQFTRPTGMMQAPLYERFIKEIAPELLYLTLYFQGEPYLNPNFFDCVGYAHRHQLYTSTSTNAHYLTPINAQKTVQSGLDRIIISLDGIDQEVYERYRVGGKVAKVIEGIENLVKAKKELKSKTPFIILQFIVFRHNTHEIEAVKQLGKMLGVDKVAIKTAQVYDYENGADWIPEEEQYARYKPDENGVFHLKGSLENSCWRMWNSCVMTWDGTIVPCCFDKDASFVLGSVEKEDFKTLWRGEKYKDFRQKLLKGRNQIEICKNCTEGTKVWV